MRSISRQPAGTSSGGQFAPHAHADQDGTLESGDADSRDWGSTGVREGTRTPWGTAQWAEEDAPGITAVGTASHGGIKLSRERNRKVHPALRNPSGWYEEDGEWAKVAMTFPGVQRHQDIEKAARDPERRGYDDIAVRDGISHAERIVRDYWPDEYEKATGRTVRPGESHERDRKLFEEANKDKPVVHGASTSENHPGMVEVDARVRSLKAEARYLVPKSEYDQRGRFGFVIDPARHQKISGDGTGQPTGPVAPPARRIDGWFPVHKSGDQDELDPPF